MTKIKICGLKRLDDIEYVNESMPDFIGFVFAGTKRKIDSADAKRFKFLLKKDIKTVGVFQNESIDNIAGLYKDRIIDIVQLHGDEDEAYIKELKNRGVGEIIKAVKISKSSKNFTQKHADYMLFDGGAGDGKVFDWSILKKYKIQKPFFLAGGLNIKNVSMAIKTLKPFCIDISGGVETNGVKDAKKIASLISHIRKIKND
jgi:phosphoribosylanthranilate isomerase